MSELGFATNRLQKQVARITAVAIALFSAGELSQSSRATVDTFKPESPADYLSWQRMERCFPETLAAPKKYRDRTQLPPLPKIKDYSSYDAYIRAGDRWDRTTDEYWKRIDEESKIIKLHATPEGIKEDPRYINKSVGNFVKDAVVRIKTVEGWEGSGVITKDYMGRRVVLTAGHVTENLPFRDLTIVDRSGRKTHPIAGCYIYEDKGHMKKFEDKAVVSNDIAVLKMAEQIGYSTLSLAKREPKRGEWEHFINYQQNAPIRRPDEYAGIVGQTYLSNPNAEVNVITGLQYWRGHRNLIHYSTQPGASGGPVVNKFGHLVGISTAASRGGLDESALMKLDNIKIKGRKQGHGSGLMPIESLDQQPWVIRAALDYPQQ